MHHVCAGKHKYIMHRLGYTNASRTHWQIQMHHMHVLPPPLACVYARALLVGVKCPITNKVVQPCSYDEANKETGYS